MKFIIFSYWPATLRHRQSFISRVDPVATTVKTTGYILTLGLALSLIALVSPVFAAPGGPTGTNGSYKIVFAGGYVGEGNAAVGTKGVTLINGTVTDVATGVTGKFQATNLATDDGGFVGTGTVMGIPVTISGRVESADGKIVLVPRMCCTFSTGAGNGGRIIGHK